MRHLLRVAPCWPSCTLQLAQTLASGLAAALSFFLLGAGMAWCKRFSLLGEGGRSLFDALTMLPRKEQLTCF